MHAIGRPEVATPGKSPFAKDMNDLAIHAGHTPLRVRDCVDVESHSPRVARWRAERASHAVIAANETPAVPIRITQVDVFLEARFFDFSESTLNSNCDNLVTVVAQPNVGVSVTPHDVAAGPVGRHHHRATCCWFVCKLTQQFLGGGCTECSIRILAIPRRAQAIRGSNRDALKTQTRKHNARRFNTSDCNSRNRHGAQPRRHLRRHEKVSPVHELISNDCPHNKRAHAESDVSKGEDIAHLCAANLC